MANQSEKRLFRKKTVERISSPEQLGEYVSVSRPAIWMVLVAVMLTLVGSFVWAVFGRIDTRIAVASVAENGVLRSYITMEHVKDVKSGMAIVTDGETSELISLSVNPVLVGDGIPAYACYLGGFSKGDWVYYSLADTSLPDGTYESFVILDSVAPISFVFA